MKLNFQAALLSITCVVTACGQTPSPPQFDALLGKTIGSPELQAFIKTNHLIFHPTEPGYAIYESTNSSLFVLLRSNRVWQVSVTLAPFKLPPDSFPPYTGTLPHGLKPGDSQESVVARLGVPSRRKSVASIICLYYDKLRLELNFAKTTGLTCLTWTDESSGAKMAPAVGSNR
jgi:hypothetical protein